MTTKELQTTVIGTKEHETMANETMSRAIYLIDADDSKLTGYRITDDWQGKIEQVVYRLETEGKRYEVTVTIQER